MSVAAGSFPGAGSPFREGGPRPPAAAPPYGQVAPAPAPLAPAPIALVQSVSGELSAGDAQRRSGKYEDVYAIAGHRGQRLQLDLSSQAFDSYLVVTGPEGFNLANDDGGEGDSTNSRILLQFPSDGPYRI